MTSCIWIFTADPLEILAHGRGCGAGREFTRLECAGSKFVTQVRKVIEDREGPTVIAPDVIHMNLPEFLPGCFIHGPSGVRGRYRVAFNTGSSGSVPPSSGIGAHRALCKTGLSATCLREAIKKTCFYLGKSPKYGWVG